MPDKGLHVQQNENVDRGRLQVNVTSTLGLQPVVNARVGIAYTGESQRLLEELETDSSGQTEAVTLDAPPVEYSQEPDRPQPFSEYTVTVQAEGYRSVEVSAIDVFANVTALQVYGWSRWISHRKRERKISLFHQILCGEIFHQRFRKMR